ncbi:MAG: endo-1,4-beta-xylanase [Ignavibacteriaceae bacterium]|nr:endo-1,4-beta-xylanase [Ignavibacteriaceae bacterium]
MKVIQLKFLSTISILLLYIILLHVPNYCQPLSKNENKFLGAGSSSSFYRNFDKYWNQLTPGNDGKWGTVEAVKGQYNWTNLDKLYNYSVGKNLLFKEHTFVWGQQQPGWISSLDSAAQRQAVEDWIRNFC